MATISELLQMGYDPRRMAQGKIGGLPAQDEPGSGLSDAELLQMGYDPARVSQGAIRGLPQAIADPQMQQQMQQPVAPPAQSKLRDLNQIRNLPPERTAPPKMANPIDNPRVPVAPGSGMLRNTRTGAEYVFNGSGQAQGPDLDYTRSPVEVYGVGKGHYIKGEPNAAMINGRRVDFNLLGRDIDQEINRENSALLRAKTIQNMQRTDAEIGRIRADTAKTERSMQAPKESPREIAAYKFGLKQLERDEKDIEQASAVEQAANRWRQLNQNVETGRIMGLLPAIGSPERQELTQIQNFLTMNNFKPGQGAISNTEREYMKGAGPSLMNDRQTNDNITQIMIGAAQNARERAAFRQSWLEQNRNLSGADAAWQRYLDANPRFVPQKNGALVENTKRASPDEFFGLSSPQQSAIAPVQPAGSHPLDAFRTR